MAGCLPWSMTSSSIIMRPLFIIIISKKNCSASRIIRQFSTLRNICPSPSTRIMRERQIIRFDSSSLLIYICYTRHNRWHETYVIITSLSLPKVSLCPLHYSYSKWHRKIKEWKNITFLWRYSFYILNCGVCICVFGLRSLEIERKRFRRVGSSRGVRVLRT